MKKHTFLLLILLPFSLLSMNTENRDDFVMVAPDDSYSYQIVHYDNPQQQLKKASGLIKLSVMEQSSDSGTCSNSQSDHNLPFSQGLRILTALLQQRYPPAFAYAGSLCINVPIDRKTTRDTLLTTLRSFADITPNAPIESLGFDLLEKSQQLFITPNTIEPEL